MSIIFMKYIFIKNCEKKYSHNDPLKCEKSFKKKRNQERRTIKNKIAHLKRFFFFFWVLIHAFFFSNSM